MQTIPLTCKIELDCRQLGKGPSIDTASILCLLPTARELTYTIAGVLSVRYNVNYEVAPASCLPTRSA